MTFSRNPEKLTRQLEREMNHNGIEWSSRQAGSHRTYKTDRGNVVIPMHGELPKGTFCSILRVIVRLGILTMFVLFILAAYQCW